VLVLGVSAGLLGSAYLLKNPESERYLAQLLPPAAIAVALGVAALPRRTLAAAVAGVVSAAALLVSPPRTTGVDAFPTLGTAVRAETAATGDPLVSATPDAYGVLLPDVPQRSLRAGARGLVLLDAAQRLYEPDLVARGTVVARIEGTAPLARPDGTLDTAPALLVRGVVVHRRHD
jgi:hypothetical protein